MLKGLGWTGLVAGLVLPTVMPEIANIATIALLIAGLFILFGKRQGLYYFHQPAIAILILAGVIFLIALVPTMGSIDHFLAFFILAPLWFAVCLVVVIDGIANRLTPLLIGGLALLGVAGAVGVTLFDVFVRDLSRGGILVNNPIHIADLALALGFVALVGLFDRSSWRWIVLSGPFLAVFAVYLSGSRGPLLAFIPMAMFSACFLLFCLWRSSRKGIWVIAGLIVIAGVAISPFVEFTLGGHSVSMAGVLGSLADPARMDASSRQRYIMYENAIRAFQASPVYGHGLIDFPRIVSQYAPIGEIFPIYDHLHNDIADFAVIGGSLGLLTYMLILLAPIVGAFAARQAWRGPAIYLAMTTSLGYVAMGLTNAMLGILTQTVLFGMITALIVVIAQRRD